ncbi:MAG: helix-turn-helix domain-containing protein [Janthinobacterium lividum]
MSSTIRIIRICVECQTEFTAKTTLTRFCSKSCNGKNHKRRIRNLKIEVSNKETIAKSTSLQDINQKDYLNINESCLLIGISRTTLWRLIKSQNLKAHKVGNRIIIKRMELEQILKPI